MSTRNVVVTKEQDRLIETLIERGRYQNASEVMRAGLRLVEEREVSLEEIRASVREGLEDIGAGRVRDGEEAIKAALDWAKAHARK